MGLYCLGALHGLWGFCVREWLGGFGACCVFALLFVLLSFRFPLLSCFRPALLLGFLPCLLCCFFGFVGWFLCLVVLLFLFPFRTIRKKKGRKGFAPCVLSSCVAGRD